MTPAGDRLAFAVFRLVSRQIQNQRWATGPEVQGPYSHTPPYWG